MPVSCPVELCEKREGLSQTKVQEYLKISHLSFDRHIKVDSYDASSGNILYYTPVATTLFL